MTWTQPLCADCWNRDHPDRPVGNNPVGPPDRCCKCGDPTRSGIYVRLNPAEVPYPKIRKEDE